MNMTMIVFHLLIGLWLINKGIIGLVTFIRRMKDV